MKPQTTLTAAEIEAVLTLVRQHWPELAHYEEGVQILALNRLQTIAETDGVAAITPARLSGQREIVEDYILPFAEVARIQQLIADQQAAPGATEPLGKPRNTRKARKPKQGPTDHPEGTET